MKGLKKILKTKRARNWGIFVMLIYFFIYYWSINYLNFGSYSNNVDFFLLDNWKQLITKGIAPFLYEPIGYIELFKSVRFFIAPVNLVLATFLSVLVFINISAAIYMFSLPKQCRMDSKYKGLIGILPSFLTGFACCTPIFLIPLASVLGSTTAFLSKIFQWLLPISVLLLIYGAVSSLKKISSLE